MSVSIASLQVEHHESGFGIGHAAPRLSWRFGPTDHKDWSQVRYKVDLERDGKTTTHEVEGDQSVLVPWPSAPLRSRESANIQVTAYGKDNQAITSPRITIETGLLSRDDWKAKMISGPPQPNDQPKPPFCLQKTFTAPSSGRARIYATAQGLYTLELNGKRVGDQVLSPGWTSYRHHLNYQVYDVSSLLLSGKNTLLAHIGEGWYAGRLGFAGDRNVFGDRIGLLAQVEVDGQVLVSTDDSWDVLASTTTAGEIYNGETYDSTLQQRSLESTGKAEVINFPAAQLIATDAPPVRKVIEVPAVAKIVTPSGKLVLDFGQNLVGWARPNKDFAGDELVVRHAEVLEHGELGTRPLRSAAATARYKLGGNIKDHEPMFTFYGFRYIEVSGANVETADFTAIVICSDMRRTGTFDSSHQLVNQLHRNVVWGMRGNFVSLPTDCPQRDERLGWTGDIQVFAPTANFLFDTSGFLGGWLKDLAAETTDFGGTVPEVVPYIPMHDGKARPNAVWADVSSITPYDLYTAFGDKEILVQQFESMCMWLDSGFKRRPNGLWESTDKQFGDWLDPKSPPALPAHCTTDPFFVSNAYLVHTTRLVAQIAKLIGKDADAKRFGQDYVKLRKEFHDEYITPKGRPLSDSQTALCLALHFDLLDTPEQRQIATERLDWLVRWDSFKVSTGFAGTPIILNTLAEVGKLSLAYRLLQEKDTPSWLQPVTMGATTIWERWNSMLPDGTINPGQMTSFNHYALGSVAHFLHTIVGGLSPLEPGWKKALIQPQPGGTLTSCKVSFDSPYGPYEVDWKLNGATLSVKARVPPNATADVRLPGVEKTVGSGSHQWEAKWEKDPSWPPVQLKGPTRVGMSDEFLP